MRTPIRTLQLSLAIALAGALPACTSPETPTQNHIPAQPATPASDPPRPHAEGLPCNEGAMTQDIFKFRETTSNTLSNKDVGIGNIFERDLPDDKGVTASRLSAVLVIHDPATDATRRETVFAGNIVTIGADRYCVVSLERGQGAPGWISLRPVK